MRKGMSNEELRSSLLLGNFGGGGELPPPSDPITAMPMVVEIEHIKVYDGNIRLVRNPKHDDIRHAIRTQGPEAAGVLAITRRPGEDQYMIAKGGNTRLQILRDCWSETREPRFRSVQCLFHPWPGEFKVLADHIAENENRGEMTFIEKALALRDLRQRMEQDSEESLSLREFVRRLNEPEFGIGLSVSKTHMIRLQYAAEFLYPLLPESLQAGLGARHVERIQKLEATYADYWRRRNPEGSNESFRVLFADALSEHDGPDFVLELVQQAVESRLAEALSRPLHSMQAELAALAAGIDIDEGRNDIDFAALAATSPAIHPLLSRQPTSAPQVDMAKAATPTAKSPIKSSVSRHHENKTPFFQTASISVSEMRTHAYESVRRLARGRGLEACVSNSPNCGLGYWIDLPERSVAGDAATAALWWMLVGLSEQLARLPSTGINHAICMPANSQLRTMVDGNRWDEIHARVGRASSWIVLPHLLQVSDSDIEDWVLLFRTVWGLRRVVAEADLWNIRTVGSHNDKQEQ